MSPRRRPDPTGLGALLDSARSLLELSKAEPAVGPSAMRRLADALDVASIVANVVAMHIRRELKKGEPTTRRASAVGSTASVPKGGRGAQARPTSE